jgi:O-antigen/teichoic acid export membrane protein
MLNTFRSSFKNSIVYGLGNIAVKLIGFLLIPLYTDPKFFSVEDFGLIGLLDISGLVLIAFLGSSLPQSLTRWYWDKDHLNNQKSVFFMTLAMQTAISVSFCLLLMPLAKSFSVMILHSTDYTRVINYVIISSGLQAINTIISTLMRLQSKSVLYTVTNLAKLVLVLSLTIFLIVFRKMGIEGVYLAQVIGNLFFILILLGYTAKNIKISIDRDLVKSMFIFGVPLILANISGVALNVIDRYSLNSMDLMKYVALYTLAFKISSVLKLVIVDSIKMAISPLMIQKIHAPDNMRFYSKVLLYSSYVLMLGIIIVSLFSFELIKVMTKSNQYWEAYIIIPVLCLSVFFVNLKDITTYGLFIVKRTKILGGIVFVASVLNLGLNLVLIPLWGIIGAAMATLTAQLIYWLITYYFSQKEFHIPYELRKLFIMLIIGAILSSTGLVINDLSLALRLIIKSACIISFPFILGLFSFYETVELKAIRGFVVKWSDLKKLGDNIKSLKAIKDVM